MAHTIVVFLPFLVCTFWLLLMPLIARRSKTFWRIEFCLFSAAMAGLATTNVLNGQCNTSTLVYFLIEQFMAPMVIPLSIIYLRTATNDEKESPISSLGWISVPFSLLFAEIILLLICGVDTFQAFIGKLMNGLKFSMLHDRVEQIIYLCSVWIFGGFIAIETLVYAITTIIKAFKHKAVLQSWNMLILFILSNGLLITFLTTDWRLSIATDHLAFFMSVFAFIISYTALFEDQESLTIRKLLKGPQISSSEVFENAIDTVISKTAPEVEDDVPIRNSDDLIQKLRLATASNESDENEESDSAPVMSAEFEDSLRIRFEDLVISEQLFLQKGLKISDIATKLSTNRTYISRLVNNTYNMSFSDYINTLRIDYAEQYLIHNKGAKQTDIAEACGFPNASSFNNIFKKITGVTPKIWLATRS